MKRAPIIPKVVTTPSSKYASETPAAPVVDSLIARVSAMARGNTITLPVCGRDVRFTLETISREKIETESKVWVNNERDQALLTEEALDDLIPSFLISGQQNPAFGRKVADVIEVADGSRRRMTAILTACDFRILVGDLDDEQMDSLSKLGNDYRPTSAYERGHRYMKRLNNEFGGNVSALSEAEHISRKIISRCMNTAKLPKELVALFSHPGELSARAGEELSKVFASHEATLLARVKEISKRKAGGEKLDAEVIITELNGVKVKSSSDRIQTTKRQYAPGAISRVKGNQFILSLDTSVLPADVVKRIEAVLLDLQSSAK
ncbi:ParB/RepB/Spo0J family plasmid partition protein [Buttiauxella agrestis]|uniref:ParB family chromosome/plasmid partitioning protein n=1 Tax=Buttiauxella agrestis ATCC 33320 TaxID=1006004 RepID=A0A085FYW3_9ENTR|nr:ParB/RepB/Spo0J family plasmid partition protein [Buttiauxella agrestis]KFC76658.1 ParB family chromosome/plasmid partitioning protein [Buttiauxella agrestis ATCC 33320]